MLKTFLISGALSLALAGGLWYQHKIITAQEVTLQTTQTTVKTLQDQNTAFLEFQEKVNVRLNAVESRKQDFAYKLGKAIDANPTDAARVTPPAIVSELCAFAKCRDQAPVNPAGR